MRILILNQYIPPDPSPTAKLVGGLGTALRAEGHEVHLVGAHQDYRVRARGRVARARRELRALVRLGVAGWRAGPADVVLSTSSPPASLILATLLAGVRRATGVHWAMDLYPELAFALGGRVPSVVAHLLYAVTGTCYRRQARTVCLDGDMQAHLSHRYGIGSVVIRPWLLQQVDDLSPADLAYPAREGFTWLYSGNLGQAHEWETPLAAQALLEKKGLPVTLAFQGWGAARPAAETRARDLGLKRVEWRPYAPEEVLPRVLLRAHVMLVTQRPETQGLLWPSKLGLLMRLPRPLVFVGPSSGAIADDVRQLPHGSVVQPGAAQTLADEIARLFQAWPPADVPELRPGLTLDQAWPEWRRALHEALDAGGRGRGQASTPPI